VSDDVIIPQLQDPWMVAAFEGWNDAADAASGTVDHLIEEWDAELILELDPEDYYDFQVHRPQVRSGEDGERLIIWPAPMIYLARPPRSVRDVLLMRAPEPNFAWKAFCSTVIGMAKLAGVKELVTLGALLADSPHTRPVPVSGSTTSPALMERMSLQPSRYSGPVGITTILNDMASREGIAAASLWAAVPHYVAHPPCPKATLALLGRLEDLLDIPVEVEDLAEEARAWERGVDELASEDSEIADYVHSLEEARDTSELPEASGDAIAQEFERYLRRRRRDNPAG